MINIAAPAVLEVALGYLRAGLGVLPIRPDGSKAPALPKGHQYLRERPTEQELRRWFAAGRNGVAIPCGQVSGHLETLDFETLTVYRAWQELVECQLPGLAARLCWVQTPGRHGQPGMHARYRCPTVEVPGSDKLASEVLLDEAGQPVLNPDTGAPQQRLLIETRGEGGYAVAPGSPPACHETGGTWEHVAGPALTCLPEVTALERDVLLASARAMNSWVDPTDRAAERARPQTGGGLLPGDDYNRRGPDWAELLEPQGWIVVRAAGGVRYWRRPGKDRGSCSATTGHCQVDGIDLLHVFSSAAAPFGAGRSYSKFRALVILEHQGDFKAAARALAAQGYGERRQEGNGRAPVRPQATAAVVKLEPEPWDVPIPLEDDGSRPVPFPLEVFPASVSRFWAAVAEAANCPIDYVGLFGLAGISGAAGATLAVEIKPGWTERLACYFCNVAPKGSGKTSAYKAIFAPYFEEASRRHQAEDHRPAFVSDITVEKLADLLRENPRGLLVIREELAAWFRSMDQYKAKGSGADRQFWLEVDSGSPISVHRKNPDSPPVWVPFPCVAVAGNIQPKVLGRMTGDDDGLLDRILFSHADALVAKGETWSSVDPDCARTWATLLHTIFDTRMKGEEDGTGRNPRPFFLRLSAAARRAWEEWTNWVAGLRNDPSFPEHLKGPAIKLTGQAARLAGIRYAARCADAPMIEGEDMEAGTLLGKYFLSHARKVYAAMGRDPRIAEAQRVLAWLGRWGKPSFSRRDAWRSLRCSFSQPEDLSPPLKLLQAHGFIRWVDQGDAGTGRRPTPTYAVHPSLPDVTRDRSDGRDTSDT